MKTFAELDAKICSCTDALNGKIEGTNGKRAILLCGGTGCISSNSLEIKEKFEKAAKNHPHPMDVQSERALIRLAEEIADKKDSADE